jgi:hypothetical protein
MKDDHLISVAQLREFVKLTNSATFTSLNQTESYQWISKTLTKFHYTKLCRSEKSMVKKYLITMTGYSETQIDRLIHQKKVKRCIVSAVRTQPCFPRIYTAEDTALLLEIDNAENRRTGGAVKKTCYDMYHVYHDARFVRLANISISHIYNVRGTRQYTSASLTYTKTNPTSVNIGIRTKPMPNDVPGYLRVDSVHQGDLGKEKGVYYVHLVDEVLQWDITACVEGISELFLMPALVEALAVHPCIIQNFHSDNGSEYINTVVARLLEKLRITQTKSRSRHTNDNALVECKNGALTRKHLGYAHIPRMYASLIQEWLRDFFNPYANFHRQCAFATDVVNEKGKIKKVYKTYLTPCEKLLSLPNVAQYLKPGVTVASLKTLMMAETHLKAAQDMQNAKQKLFATIQQKMLGLV